MSTHILPQAAGYGVVVSLLVMGCSHTYTYIDRDGFVFRAGDDGNIPVANSIHFT